MPRPSTSIRGCRRTRPTWARQEGAVSKSQYDYTSSLLTHCDVMFDVMFEGACFIGMSALLAWALRTTYGTGWWKPWLFFVAIGALAFWLGM